jgi:hypothetical protein
VKRIAISALAAAIAALFLIVGAGGFTAANAAPTVQAGQLCAYHEHGDTKTASNGDLVKCQKVGHVWKWVKVVAPSQSQSAGEREDEDEGEHRPARRRLDDSRRQPAERVRPVRSQRYSCWTHSVDRLRSAHHRSSLSRASRADGGRGARNHYNETLR